MVSFLTDISLLSSALTAEVKPYSSVFILVDENTAKHCLPLISASIPDSIPVQIKSGEEHKNITTCSLLWSVLTDHEADRKSLLINLGGGVITDMGGFAASCYKRGIDFINIPTTLLAMVDASVGGKTGIDFYEFKNQIGVFSEAKEVLICPAFLKTLDARQLRSGMAEVLKHYLIADGQAFLDHTKTSTLPDLSMIKKAIAIKSDIVAQDPFEKNVRKKLNFGHTVGHALESYSLTTSKPLLHGEAVAYGMAIETQISLMKSLIVGGKSKVVCTKLQSDFALKPLSGEMIDGLMSYIGQDKKNERGKIKMALIDDIGSCRIDVEVTLEEVRDAIAQFNESGNS
jgi:3-dehydroquinate synthase